MAWTEVALIEEDKLVPPQTLSGTEGRKKRQMWKTRGNG
jgi:hypothetical protein